MKPIKLFALILAVCLLSCAFVACDSGDSGTDAGTDANAESATQAAEEITIKNVTLIIHENGKDTNKGDTIDYKGTDNTLASVIKYYCIYAYGSDEGCFDNTGLLSKVGELQGTWNAYDKDKGSTKGAIPSIATYEVTEGVTIVLNCSTK